MVDGLEKHNTSNHSEQKKKNGKVLCGDESLFFSSESGVNLASADTSLVSFVYVQQTTSAITSIYLNTNLLYSHVRMLYVCLFACPAPRRCCAAVLAAGAS